MAFLNLCLWKGKAFDVSSHLGWHCFSKLPLVLLNLRDQECQVLYQAKDEVFDKILAVQIP